MPVLSVAFGHTGVPTAPRTHPERSDVALFAVATLGVWIVRRALRRRLKRD